MFLVFVTVVVFGLSFGWLVAITLYFQNTTYLRDVKGFLIMLYSPV